MARTTYTELDNTLEALQRATGVAPGRLGIARSGGRHCVVLDDGKRDVSPWLTLGELRNWMWAAISGAHLLREDGEGEIEVLACSKARTMSAGVYCVHLDAEIIGTCDGSVFWAFRHEPDAQEVAARLNEHHGRMAAWVTYEPIAESLDDSRFQEVLDENLGRTP